MWLFQIHMVWYIMKGWVMLTETLCGGCALRNSSQFWSRGFVQVFWLADESNNWCKCNLLISGYLFSSSKKVNGCIFRRKRCITCARPQYPSGGGLFRHFWDIGLSQLFNFGTPLWKIFVVNLPFLVHLKKDQTKFYSNNSEIVALNQVKWYFQGQVDIGK